MGHIPITRRRPGESGQTTALTLIILAVFLLGVLGFATDYAQVWAHRQMAQSAADAACQAGAADLFLNYANSAGASSGYGLEFGWIGSDFNCSPSSTDPVCKYAAINGYSGGDVRVTFPTSVPGVPSLGTGYGTVSNPYIKVTVSDNSPLTFSRFFQTASSLQVKASATCGISPVAVPIPLVVLNKSVSGSLSLNGNPIISIFGGPPRSIQVDSSSSSAVTVSGAPLVDLHQAGPSNSGGDVGVFGNEPQLPAKNLNLGAGKWIAPAFPYGDPWALIAAPSAPGTAGSVIYVGYNVNGCPDPSGCAEFSGGNFTACDYQGTGGKFAPGGKICPIIPMAKPMNYGIWTANTNYTAPTEIQVGGVVYLATKSGKSGAAQPPWPLLNQTVTDGGATGVTWMNVGSPTSKPNTAIFDPGLYYLDNSQGQGALQLNSGSTVRPSTATGDGSYGTTFYFSAGGTQISVAANSGSAGGLALYTVAGNAFSTPLQCTNGPSNPAQVPATVSGNILLGPCTGTYAAASTDGHQYRGFLFFGSRASAGTASWGGGGQFLLAGFMYFHDTSYSSTLSLQGNSGAGAYTLGNIVADKVSLGGTTGIKMILNPASSYQILRPTLLQ